MQPTLQNGKVVEREKPLETVIDFLGTTSSAKDEIAALFGDRTAFATPKPMKLIKEFVRAASEKIWSFLISLPVAERRDTPLWT